MSVFHENMLIGSSGQGGAAAYQIQRSIRLNAPDSAYLSRTPSSTGNRRTWTFSCWLKRTSLADSIIIGAGSSDTNRTLIGFGLGNNDNKLYILNNVGGGGYYSHVSNAVFRDTSAWYHFVIAADTAQSVAADRFKFYVNGVLQTWASAANLQNTDTLINTTNGHAIGSNPPYGVTSFFNGYLADIHLIDGQALTASSFGETDINGVWQPKAYSGTYGTNGFRLDFSDNSAATATTLGKDRAGSNNWTPSGLSVTAGAGNDSLVDSSTNYGSDTGVGGEVRGNYCTLNPLANNGGTLSNGNYDHSGTIALTVGTLFPSSGKWYFEVTCNTYGGGSFLGYTAVGVIKSDQSINTAPTSAASVPSGLWVYRNDALKINNGTSVSYGNTWTAGDVIGVAFDVDAGKVWFAKNGTWQASGDPAAGTNAAYTNLSGSIGVAINDQGTYTTTYSLNTGARVFAYTAPSGFKALCSQNLPTPTITKGSSAMDVVLYTGTGAALTPTSTLGFSPDLVWIKGRSGATDHALYDTVRGATIDLVSNSSAAETTQTQGLTAFNSNGFSVGTLAKINTNAATYAGWCWDAGSSTVTNTAGTISSQVRANASAGFSAVTGLSPSSGFTVGHGLGVAPNMIIFKNRDTSDAWYTWHTSIGTASSGKYLQLNTTAAVQTAAQIWNATDPTSTIFGLGRAALFTADNQKFVAYCFAPVNSYSAFGAYQGNGSADGPFVYTGFRPRWVMIKASSASGSHWLIIDATRSNYNQTFNQLYANLANAEDINNSALDLLANGFKCRADTFANINGSGTTYIYAAFAEHPFSLARAR